MSSYREQRDEINRLFNAPQHRKLKYVSLMLIGLGIIAEIAMIIWFDDIPDRSKILIRGCIGICAILFVILVTILAYRVFSEYFRGKPN